MTGFRTSMKRVVEDKLFQVLRTPLRRATASLYTPCKLFDSDDKVFGEGPEFSGAVDFKRELSSRVFEHSICTSRKLGKEISRFRVQLDCCGVSYVNFREIAFVEVGF